MYNGVAHNSLYDNPPTWCAQMFIGALGGFKGELSMISRQDLKRFKRSRNNGCANHILIPVNIIPINDEGMSLFNDLVQWCEASRFNGIIRTKSGGISTKTQSPAYDIRRTKWCVELTILDYDCYRFQFTGKKDESKLSGRKAFVRFKKMLKEDGIDLDTYAIKNGPDIKKTIQKPMIYAPYPEMMDLELKRVHHIDFHSSYASGLALTHPEMRPTIERIFERKEKGDKDMKAILNYSIGFMQSIGGCQARWAHLSRDAIANNNDRMRKMVKRLEEFGAVPILFNVDGIWYVSQKPYHADDECDELGGWVNDHINCRFRMKSAGAYEYEENGKYTAVIRGVTEIAKEHWHWGGIYTEAADTVAYIYDKTAKRIRRIKSDEITKGL